MSRQCRVSGFSLIEILVVIVIIGIVSSIALMSLGILSDDRDLRVEAQRMLTLLEIAGDEAMMQGREFGLEVMTDSFRFVEYDPLTSQWNEVLGDDTLRLRRLPEDVEFDLFLEDQRILLEMDPADFDKTESMANRDPSKTYTPHLLILSSGDTSPFEVHITRSVDGQMVTLSRDLAGDFEIVSGEE